jgi:hypothetical protein
VSAPLVLRPRRLTRVCWAAAVVTVGVFAAVAEALTRSAGELQFHTLDAVLMTGVGVLLAGGTLLFTRARVVAGDDGIRVRNALRERALPWAVVAGVRFEEGASWARLELCDDDEIALLAVQANDGERAVEAVRALRALLARSRETA